MHRLLKNNQLLAICIKSEQYTQDTDKTTIEKN